MRKPNRYGLQVMETDNAAEQVMRDMDSLVFSLLAFRTRDGQVRLAMSGEVTNEQSAVLSNAVLSCLEGFGLISVPAGKEEVS